MRLCLPLAALMLLAACATSGAGTPTLTDSEWRFTTIDGAAPVAPERAMLGLSGDRLSANAGCNGMGSTWRTEGGKLHLTGPLISTQMYCEGRMDQERAIGALLSANPDFTIDGDRLTLRSADHSAELRRK